MLNPITMGIKSTTTGVLLINAEARPTKARIRKSTLDLPDFGLALLDDVSSSSIVLETTFDEASSNEVDFLSFVVVAEDDAVVVVVVDVRFAVVITADELLAPNKGK